MLTSKEANDFLTNHLKFPNWKEVLEENKLIFLRLFVRKHVTHIPYQNITMNSVDLDQRHSPTNEEIIADGISGIGGVCFSLNHFAKVILDTIGFDTFAIQADSPPSTPFPGDHYIVVVKLDGEQYIVDVGQCHPVYDVIPLNPAAFPFRRQIFGFPYEYRYSIETGKYTRHHLVGGCNNGRFKSKDEEILTEFCLTPKKFEDFYETMTKIYSDPKSFLLRTFFLTRFSEISDEEMRKEDESVNPGFVIILGTTVSVGDANTREGTVFDTLDQVVPSIMKYFPKLDSKELKLAIEMFTKMKENI